MYRQNCKRNDKLLEGIMERTMLVLFDVYKYRPQMDENGRVHPRPPAQLED